MSAVPAKYQGLRSFAFGDGPALADELLDLVIREVKTATCSTGASGRFAGFMNSIARIGSRSPRAAW